VVHGNNISTDEQPSDIVRVATNVENSMGRAIGTYIPAVNPMDSQPGGIDGHAG